MFVFALPGLHVSYPEYIDVSHFEDDSFLLPSFSLFLAFIGMISVQISIYANFYESLSFDFEP